MKKFICSSLLALFASSAYAVPDIYSDSFLNYVTNNATFEENYLLNIVNNTYPGTSKDTLTFAQWKTLNGFGVLTDLNVKFYNSADLGLGRDMHCVDQSVTQGSFTGRSAGAMTCYVSNHGKIGGGADTAYTALNSGNAPFATVAMEFRVGAPTNKVRFFVFVKDANGVEKLVDTNGAPNIFLDGGLGRTQPGVCMVCHGGTTGTDASGVVTDAHFLPFDFASLEFETPEKRTAAIPIINKYNQLIRNAEQIVYGGTSRLATYLNAEYNLPQGSTTAFPTNTPMNDTYVEPAFNNNAPAAADPNSGNVKLYNIVAKNYCRTCHLAVNRTLTPGDLFGKVCQPSSMPQAEVNTKNLLRHADEINEAFFRYSARTCGLKTLEDFQWQNAEDEVITFTPSLTSGLTGNTTGFADQGKGNNQIKRSLRLSANSTYGAVIVDTPKSNNVYLPRDITKVEFLSTPLPADGSVVIRAYLFDENGSVIEDFIPTATAAVGSTFIKQTIIPSVSGVKKVEIGLKRVAKTALATTYNFTAPVEIDDVLVERGFQGIGLFHFEDFEDSSFTFPADDFTVGIQPGNILNTQSACTSIRGATAVGAAISNKIKVEHDAGRYSLASNATFCKGEAAVVSLSWPGQNAGSGAHKALSFDFVIDKQSNGKAAGVLEMPKEISIGTTSTGNDFDAVEMARHQGTLIETSTKFIGTVTVDIQYGTGSAKVRWQQLVDSGLSGGTVKGFAIDNIIVWGN